MDISEFKRRFYKTARSAGLKIISDDKCCQLLAWLLVYGGGNEQVNEVDVGVGIIRDCDGVCKMSVEEILILT